MPAPAVHIFPGVLACESALLGMVDRLLPPSGRELRDLARTVRVVVPSRSLARHLVALLVRHRGCALVGLQVQTLSALAAQVLAQAGIATAQDDALLDVLVRRRAAASSPLRDALGTLENGYGAVLRPVTTLLDAGFVAERDAAPLAGLIQSLPDAAATAEQRLRALALVTVAAQAQSDLAALGQLRHADGLRRAARLLGREGSKLGDCAVLVYGIADPSGAELDLVEVLHRQAGATVLLVAPPRLDKLVRGEADADPVDFGQVALVERLGTRPTVAPRAVQAPALRLLAAPGPTAEARAVARQVQALLTGDSSPKGRCSPEDVCIVARDMGARAHLLRPELERLGLPWSGVGAQAPPGPALRKVRALLDLLSLGADIGVDAWLDAVAVLPGVPLRALPTLRAALAVLGCSVLGDVASLGVDELLGEATSLPLPMRGGIMRSDPVAGREGWDGNDQAQGEPQGVDGAVDRMRLGRGVLESAVAAAAGLLAQLELDHSRALARWGSDIARAAHDWLGWGDPDAAWRALHAALAGLGQRAPVQMRLDRVEARLVLGPALDGAAATDIGGAGGGVQLLGAVEARGRSARHVFVLGLSRGEFPRTSRPDPLLSDALLLRMRALLPDLATTSTRQSAERRLLCFLLTGAPHITLCWPETDDDGRLVPASPLVDRIALARPDLVPVRPPTPGSRVDPPPDLAALPRPPDEHLRYRALYGRDCGPDDDELLGTLALALAADPLPGGLALDFDAVARARLAIRRELDAAPSRLGAGPYLGFVGPVGALADPRSGPVYVTTVEDVADCAWRSFLARVLRVQVLPDPTAICPGVDARAVGELVHRVLEIIASRVLTAAGRTPAPSLMGMDALARLQPCPVPWPNSEELDRLLDTAAQAVATRDGLVLPGLWRVLRMRAEPYLDVARAQDWGSGPVDVVAVECEAQARVQTPLGPRFLRFRVDRIDRPGGGALRLTDYKTGAALSSAVTARSRDAALLKATASGQRLQAALYARSVPGGGIGRYLALRPHPLDAEAPQRLAAVPAQTVDAATFDQALDHAAGVVLHAWQMGAFNPRLLTPKGKSPPACAWCELRTACLQGDSSARLRQAEWAADCTVDDGEQQAAGRALWWLGTPRPSDTADGSTP